MQQAEANGFDTFTDPPSFEEPSPKRPPLNWLDMSSWDSEPIPERKWAIRDRVPLKQAGLFSGEGGTGKSIIELMKNVAHVTAKDWMGSLPEPGPAFYIGAEDDADEIHIRLAAIAQFYGKTFADLNEGGLKVLPLLGKDATLCSAI
jgi:RecA-family ATPase